MAKTDKRYLKIVTILLLTAALLAGLFAVFPNPAYAAKKQSIKKATVKIAAQKTYTGKAIKPKVTVRVGKKKLKKNRDYTVTYKKNTQVGTAAVVIKGKGKYKGKITKRFQILPQKAVIRSVTAVSTSQLLVTWKAQSGVSGYQIQYAPLSGADDPKTVTASAASVKLKHLKAGTKYRVYVRAFKKETKKTIFGDWSKKKDGQTKTKSSGTGSTEQGSSHEHVWQYHYEETYVPEQWSEAQDYVRDGHYEIHEVCYCGQDLQGMTGEEVTAHQKQCGYGGRKNQRVWIPEEPVTVHVDPYLIEAAHYLVHTYDICECGAKRYEETHKRLAD